MNGDLVPELVAADTTGATVGRPDGWSARSRSTWRARRPAPFDRSAGRTSPTTVVSGTGRPLEDFTLRNRGFDWVQEAPSSSVRGTSGSSRRPRRPATPRTPTSRSQPRRRSPAGRWPAAARCAGPSRRRSADSPGMRRPRNALHRNERRDPHLHTRAWCRAARVRAVSRTASARSRDAGAGAASRSQSASADTASRVFVGSAVPRAAIP